MDEPLRIPIELPGADRANLELDQLLASFTKLERETIALATANERSAQHFNALIEAFKSGHISGDQLRATLAAIAAQAPRSAAELRRLAETVETVAPPSALSRWSAYATGISSTIHIVQSAVGAFDRVATSIADLATEQENLNRNSARIGVNFDEASAAAGRFADETTAMAAATRLFEAGIRPTQEQLNALMRVAGEFSQTTGVTVEQAVEQLTTGLVNGSARGLRPFGEEMMAVAGNSHTVEERLAALVSHAGHVERATDTARDRMERFKDSIGDQMRSAASTFTTTLAGIQQRADAARGSVGSLTSTTSEFGDALNTFARGAARAWAVFGESANYALVRVRNDIDNVVDGLDAVARITANPLNAATIAEDLQRRVSARNAENAAAGAGVRAALFDDPAAGTATGRAATGAAPGSTHTAEETAHDARQAYERQGHLQQAQLDKDRHARGRHTRGGRGHHEPTMAEAIQHKADEFANAQAANLAGALGAAQHEADATNTRLAGEIGANDERVRRASTRTRAGGAPGDVAEERLRQREQARTRRMLDDQVDMQRTFVDRMEEQHHRHVDVTREAAESLDAAFKGVGEALGSHIAAWAAGKEDLADAAQGFLADSLGALAKEAQGKGAFYAAEALGLLVSGNFPMAATAGIASAAYFAASGTLGYLAGEAAPAPAAKPSAGGGGGRASARNERLSPAVNSPGLGDDGPVIVNNYYAPVIGGRESTSYETGNRLGRFNDASSRRQVRERS